MSGGGLYSEVPYLEVRPCTVRSNASWVEVQCIMGNGYVGPPVKRQTDRHD